MSQIYLVFLQHNPPPSLRTTGENKTRSNDMHLISLVKINFSSVLPTARIYSSLIKNTNAIRYGFNFKEALVKLASIMNNNNYYCLADVNNNMLNEQKVIAFNSSS